MTGFSRACAAVMISSRVMGLVFRDFRDDDSLRVCILRAEGEKFFCPGWDLKAAADGDAVDGDYGVGGFGGLQELPNLNKPVIAAVNGICCGGGLELALMADLIVLGQTAKLGLPETNLGLIPGAGGSQRLMALIGRARASRLVLTGEIIDAATAHDWGLSAYLATADALPEAEALTAKIATRAPLALQAAKAALVAGSEASLAFTLERQGFEALQDSADKTEGIRAFREKRKPNFKGT